MASVTDPNQLHPSDPLIPNAMVEDDVYEEPNSRRRFLIFNAMPAWAVSTFVHVIILLVLGLVSIADPVKIVNVLSASATAEEGPEMEEFAIEQLDPGEVAEMEEITETTVDTSEQIEMPEPTTSVESIEIAEVAIDMGEMASDMAPAATSLQTLSSVSGAPMSSRSADMKKKLLRDYGGSASSEAAVTEALKWFSRHQFPNGGWSFQHNVACNNRCGDPGEPKRAGAVNAATAMALLPFMGAGQTHKSGDFRENVYRGLKFLISNGKLGKKNGMPVLDLTESAGNGMYSHGLASIALCEAYAMTGDPELAMPAQASINFIVYAQCRDGGWRYQPQQADGGDTSVVGWQVMALKSAHMGHLLVPPTTVQGSVLFLDKVQSNNGATYGYASPSAKVRPACTAVGVLCRMYTGWSKTDPRIVAGVKEVAKIGFRKDQIYYDYYAAQVLRQFGGAEWDKFNNEMRDWLVETQSQDGGAKGSWHFPKGGHGPKDGGRLASTSFATMMLEVYYRHMPLYADNAAEDDFPL